MSTGSTALLVLLVLLLLVYNAQVARVVRLDGAIDDLQERQEAIIEENKRIMAARELVRDPQVVAEIAERELGYQILTLDSVLYLDVQQ